MSPAELELPAARVRELLLVRAWSRAAGEALARRTVAVRVQRGVLEVELPDRRWAVALEGRLEELARRVASEAPDLRIRRFRARIAGESATDAPRPIDPSSGERAPR